VHARNKKAAAGPRRSEEEGYIMKRRTSSAGLAATYSSKSLDLVPSALGSLTAEFGMGSGTGDPLITPGRQRADNGRRMTADGCKNESAHLELPRKLVSIGLMCVI